MGLFTLSFDRNMNLMIVCAAVGVFADLAFEVCQEGQHAPQVNTARHTLIRPCYVNILLEELLQSLLSNMSTFMRSCMA